MSRIRAVRRRFRCLRKGHYWLQRLDSQGEVTLFCRRCGRDGRHLRGIDVDAEQLAVRVSVN